jgi:hypothetical protein
MFYTFIVLFEKIKYSDRPYGSLQRFYYKGRKVTNLALMGWRCYNFGISTKVIRFCRLFKIYIYLSLNLGIMGSHILAK